MNTEVAQLIQQQLADNKVIIYIKGTPQFPQCGFSSRAVQALKSCGVEFNFVNILENPDIRQTLPQVSNWPTFPQLFINGELVGGCDIIVDLQASGELADMLAKA